MAISTVNIRTLPYGKGGRDITMPVDGGTHIYEGTLVAQLTATGMLVPASTASSGTACGVATHEQDNTAGADAALRCTIETDRIFLFANAAGGDAATEATLLGALLYAVDDHTVGITAGALQPAGLFAGLEPDGKVRCYVTFMRSLLIDAT